MVSPSPVSNAWSVVQVPVVRLGRLPGSEAVEVENPNDVAARFVMDHPGWELVLDDAGDVMMIIAPNYLYIPDEN